MVDNADTQGLVGIGEQVSEGDITRVGVNGAVRLYGNVWLDLLWERPVRGENIGAGTSFGIGVAYSG